MLAVDDTVRCHQQSMALLAHPVATLHAQNHRFAFTQFSDSLGGGFKFGLSNTMTFQHRITIDDTQKNVMASGITLVRTLLREEYNVQLLTVWEGS